jgi:hypothetical protein
MLLCVVLDFLAVLALLHLMLDIAKGWPISTNYVPGRRINYAIIAFFALIYIMLFIWDNLVRDPASVLYLYESPPGYAIIALRFLVMLWFLYCIQQTFRLENEQRKRGFYMVMTIFCNKQICTYI